MQNITNHIKSNRYFTTIGLSALFFLFLLTLTILLPLDWSEDTTEAVTGSPILSETSLTMTSTSNIASVDLSVNNGNGTFATSDSNNQIKFNISTTNYTGYTLSIKNSKSTTTLVNSTNSSYTLSSLTGTVTPTNFSADSTTAATNYNGKWGYYPSKYNSSTNSYYRPSPTTSASTLDKTSSANTSGTVNSYTIGIGARASYTTPAGEYTGTYILTVVGNAIAYYVSFLDNSGDSTVSGLPSSLSGSVSTTSITLPSTIPTRTGHTFKSWCLGAVSNNGTTCTGTQYNKSSSFGLDQVNGGNGTSSNPVVLYALWTINTYPCYAEYRLQNADSTYPSTYTSAGIVNSAVAYGSTCTYTSNQDTTYYTNQTASQTVTDTTTLRLDIPRTTYALTVSRNTTYISSVTGAGTYRWGQTVAISATASTGNKFTSWSQTAGTGNGTTTNFASSTSASTTFTMPASSATVYANGEIDAPSMQTFTKADCQSLASSSNYTVIDSRDNNTYTVRYINGNCWMTQNMRIAGGTQLTSELSNVSSSYTLPQSSTSDFNDYSTSKLYCPNNSASTGCWYNYKAATAGSVYGNPSTSFATYSICPAGWRLPTYSETKTIGTGDSTYISAFRPVSGGYYNNSSLGNTSYGYWWSSTSSSGTRRYALNYTGSILRSGDGYDRYRGHFVRCICSA